jgi:hypothetical protein
MRRVFRIFDNVASHCGMMNLNDADRQGNRGNEMA